MFILFNNEDFWRLANNYKRDEYNTLPLIDKVLTGLLIWH